MEMISGSIKTAPQMIKAPINWEKVIGSASHAKAIKAVQKGVKYSDRLNNANEI